MELWIVSSNLRSHGCIMLLDYFDLCYDCTTWYLFLSAASRHSSFALNLCFFCQVAATMSAFHRPFVKYLAKQNNTIRAWVRFTQEKKHRPTSVVMCGKLEALMNHRRSGSVVWVPLVLQLRCTFISQVAINWLFWGSIHIILCAMLTSQL